MAKKPQAPQPVKPVSYTELSGLSKADLSKKASELREEIVSLKRATIAGEVQNFKVTGVKRKELARTLTALSTKGEEEK